MFTGLVEGIARLQDIEQAGPERRLTIEVPESLLGAGGCRLGESVALDGCCLTAVAVAGRAWTFQAGAETLSRTTLGQLEGGEAVNVERALPAAGRFGGHLVQGHIDGMGEVAGLEQEGDWTTLRLTVGRELLEELVPKGSLAIDGVSLTVVEVTESGCSIALIPHTLAETTLGRRTVGDRVNLETDVIGKYVHRWLANRFS